MTVSDFARQLNCERTNVYTIFKRRTIDVELLVIISKVLRYNFFEEILKQVDLDFKRQDLNINIKIQNLSKDKITLLKELLEKINK